MSLMTGLPPSVHRVEENWDRLPETIQTLAGVLKEAGYRTAGFTSHVYVDGRYGFARGFDEYETRADQRGAEVTGKALGWLRRPRTEPFFLFLHYFDPHWSYDAPNPRFGPVDPRYGETGYLLPFLGSTRRMSAEALGNVIDLYDSEIAYTDREIGRVLSQLRESNLLDDTIVVVTSDHGEEFFEHGTFGHGGSLFGEVTRVPLIMRFPGREGFSGQRPGLASLVDVPATVLSLAGLDVPEQFRHWAVNLSAEPPQDRFVVLESSRWGPKRFAVREAGHKLVTPIRYRPFVFERGAGEPVETPEIRLAASFYDLLRDPLESKDLIGDASSRERIARAREKLQEYLDRSVRTLRLTCEGASGAELSGVIRFDAPLVDEPFPAPGVRATITTLTPSEYRIVLGSRSEGASIHFPVPDDPGTVALAWRRSGGEVRRETAPIPGPGESRRLDERCRIWVPAYELPARRETRELTEDEIERLRTLGYIE